MKSGNICETCPRYGIAQTLYYRRKKDEAEQYFPVKKNEPPVLWNYCTTRVRLVLREKAVEPELKVPVTVSV